VTVVPAVDTLRPRTSEERHAQAYVLGTEPWAQAMEQLREDYARAGRVDDAVRVARAMALEYRYSAQPYRDAARLAAGQGRWVEAAGYARLAAARQETHDDLRLAGLLLVRAGDHAAAVPYLERLAQRDASDPRLPAMARAARVLPQLEAGRRGGAREPSLLYSLAAAYALTEQPDRAREALGALFAVEPSHPAGRELERRLPPAG
jgi:tetratricopeptide (TPR) repeat protein